MPKHVNLCRCYPLDSIPLKEEPLYQTEKMAVSWHADSSLEHYSSIAAYHVTGLSDSLLEQKLDFQNSGKLRAKKKSISSVITESCGESETMPAECKQKLKGMKRKRADTGLQLRRTDWDNIMNLTVTF